MENKFSLKFKYAFMMLFVLALNPFSPSVKASNPSPLIKLISEKNYFSCWNGEDAETKILTYLTDMYNNEHKPAPEEIAEKAREIGFNYSILGNNYLATYYYTYAVQLVPKNADYHLDLALELWCTGKTDQAKDQFEIGYKLDANNSSLLKMYGHFNFSQNKFPEAIELYNKSLKCSDSEHNSNYEYIMKHIAQLLISQTKKSTKIISENQEWPYQIVQCINGEIDEAKLAKYIKDQNDEDLIREQLCEALYYLGYYKIAIGDTFNGELMIKQCLNTRLPAFIEYNLALNHVLKNK
ncbi:MAG: hypothetical protein JZU53_07900 [Paludibacter sp.]|nr:hypothetical protein [Paludibacter sp.]